MPNTKALLAGIDLGTTYSTVAVMTDSDRVEFLQDSNRDVVIPSALYIDDEGKAHVGISAVNAELACPSKVIRFSKRGLEDRDDNGERPIIHISTQGQEMTSLDAVVLMLKHFIEKTEEQTGERIDRAVLTVPHNFTDAGRRDMREAGKLAGLTEVRIIDEPTAAAIAFGLDKSATGTVFVVDTGGGTSDMTALQIEDGKFRALATSGISHLGGVDIDNLLIDLAERRFIEETGSEDDIRTDPLVFAPLRNEAQRVKETLSDLSSTNFTAIIGNHRLSFEVTRDDFEKMLTPFLEKVEALLRETLDKAKLTPDDLDNVVLIGGTNRIPAIKELIEKVTGKTPRVDVDPRTAVAYGAALFAQVVNWDESAEEVLDRSPTDDLIQLSLRDKIRDLSLICAHSFGVAAKVEGDSSLRGKMVLAEVYPGQAPLGQTFTQQFRPEHPYQRSVLIQVLQGVAYSPVEECLMLGEFSIPISSRREIDYSVEVSFKYNIDGIIEVEALDKVGGNSGKTTVEVK